MNLKLLFGLIFLIGVGLFAYSFKLPYYIDEKAYENLEYSANNKIMAGDHESYKEGFYKKREALKTGKTFFMDLGSGMTVAALCILIFLFTAKVKNLKDLHKIKSLSATNIYLVSNIAWLLMIPGTYWYYFFRAGRGDYPPFADSIGIPIMETMFTITLCFLFLNLFLLFTVRKANLPNQVFIKPVKYSTKEIWTELFWGGLLLLNITLLFLFIIDGDHVSIVVNLIFTYILLSLRAGQISSQEVDAEPALAIPS